MTSTHTILCGACKCPAEAPPNPKPNDKVTCPRCHRSDSFNSVMRVVQEHVVHETQKQLNASLASATRGNKYVKFTAKSSGYRSFRWVAAGVGR